MHPPSLVSALYGQHICLCTAQLLTLLLCLSPAAPQISGNPVIAPYLNKMFGIRNGIDQVGQGKNHDPERSTAGNAEHSLL